MYIDGGVRRGTGEQKRIDGSYVDVVTKNAAYRCFEGGVSGSEGGGTGSPLLVRSERKFI